MFLIVEITDSCNAHCKHCSISNNKKPGFMPLEKFKQFLYNWGKELDEYKIRRAVAITGGEPTLHPDFLKFVEAANDLGYITSVFSNGSNPKLLKSCTADKIQLSLDFFGEAHNRFRGIPGLFKKIKKLAIEDKRVKIRSTIFNDNFQDLNKIYNLCKRYNTIHICVSSFTYKKPSSEQIEKVKKRNPCTHEMKLCTAGVSSLTVDCHGNVYPCLFYRKKMGDTSMTLEDLVTRGVERYGEKKRCLAYYEGDKCV